MFNFIIPFYLYISIITVYDVFTIGTAYYFTIAYFKIILWR